MSLGKLKRALECFDCTGNPIVFDKENVSAQTATTTTTGESGGGEMRIMAHSNLQRFNRSFDYDEFESSTANGDGGGGHNDDDDDGGSDGVLHIPVPLPMMSLYRFIQDEQLSEQVVWGRMLMQFIFDIGNSTEEPGKLMFGFRSHKVYLGSDSEEVLKRRPRLLCVHVVQHNAELMPVDTIFSLKLTPDEQQQQQQQQQQPDTPSSSAVKPATASPAYTNGAILLVRGTQKVADYHPPPVFGNVMVYEDPYKRVQFSSIEAVNFSADELWRTAVSVAHVDTHHIARLFCLHNHQRLTNAACARHGLRKQCFFLVPRRYAFTSLLQRVHDYLAIRQLTADYINLPPLSTPLPDPSLYRLPLTSDCVVFDCDSLHRAVQFIEAHLVAAHPLFVPAEIGAHLRPFVCTEQQHQHRVNPHANENTWPAVWQSRAKLAEYNRAAGHVEEANYLESNMQCSVACVVYYVTLPTVQRNAHARLSAGLTSPLRPRRRPPPLPSKRRTDLTTDDERNAYSQPDDSSTITDVRSASGAKANSAPLVPTTPPDRTAQSTIDEQQQQRQQQRARHNDNDDDDGDDEDDDAAADYDFSFGRYLPNGTPRPHYKPGVSPPPAQQQQPPQPPKSTSPTNLMGADTHGSLRTPRTEPTSDLMNVSGSRIVTSSTTKSHDGSDSGDDDDDDSEEEDVIGGDGGAGDSSSIFVPAPIPMLVSEFGSPIPLSSTPYTTMPIRHRVRSPPPPPPPPPTAPQTVTSSRTSAAGSGSEQTIFHLSASDEK